MTAEPQPCQHCLDPIVSARVYDEGDVDSLQLSARDTADLERALGRPKPYRVIWIREGDRRPYCWIPCDYEADGHHWLPHKPMPTI